MRIVFDENLAQRLAHALALLCGPEGDQVSHLFDEDLKGYQDADWIDHLGKDGDWSVVTTDRRLRRRPHEVAALRANGFVVFVVLQKHWPLSDPARTAQALLAWWSYFRQAAAGHRPAFYEIDYRLKPKGLKLWQSKLR